MEKEMDILEKCAYIKGLADGLNLDTTKPEGKVLNAIIDLLADITDTIADIDDEVATLGDYIEEIDHDLGDVETYVYECEDDCDCGCCDDEYDPCEGCEDDCESCECCCDDDCDEYFEMQCPECASTFCFSAEAEDIVCPACGKEIEVK